MKVITTLINTLNGLGANLAACPRNGYIAVDSADGRYNYYCGSTKEVAAYLRGVLSVFYNDIHK